MKKWNKIIITIVVGLFAAYSCADLDVENLNEPDQKRAIATPADVVGLAGGCYKVFHNQIYEYTGLGLPMGVMADNNTCSWGNSGMRDLSSEPRAEKCVWNNEITYSNSAVTIQMWGNMYSSMSAANDVLKSIAAGMTFEEAGFNTKMIQAWCTFIQGVTHGYLGLSFDQANIIDETSDLGQLVLSPYKDVCMAGIAYLEEALDLIAAAGSFTIPAGFIRGVTLDDVGFEQLVRGYLARLLIHWPRNGTEAKQIDWAKVKNVLDGYELEVDHAPDMDDSTWYNWFYGYQCYQGWGRVDHRIINLMDNDYASRWPMNGVWPDGDPGPAASADARLLSDFEYLPAQAFNPTRGYEHFSHYRFSRYDTWMETWTGPSNTMLGWETSMMLAEAKLKTGDKAGAIAILNRANGPRKVRGGLPDIAAGATETEVWEAIMYEKEIECYNTGMGLQYFDMRRNDMLQYGTINHFPMPKTEIELTGIPFYTIGDKTPDGWDRALYGWVGKDGLKSPYPDGWPGYPNKPDIPPKSK